MLLIYNCSAHRKENGLPNATKISPEFLPPNATRYFLPLDTGIASSLKSAYRKCLLSQVCNNIDSGSKLVYNVDIISAMKWVKD